MGIDVRTRKLAYVTYRTEKWATIPENATQGLSRYTTSVVVGDRAAGWRGPNPNIRSLRAAYLVATDAQDSPAVLDGPMGQGIVAQSGTGILRHRYKQPKNARQYLPGLPISNAA